MSQCRPAVLCPCRRRWVCRLCIPMPPACQSILSKGSDKPVFQVMRGSDGKGLMAHNPVHMLCQVACVLDVLLSLLSWGCWWCHWGPVYDGDEIQSPSQVGGFRQPPRQLPWFGSVGANIQQPLLLTVRAPHLSFWTSVVVVYLVSCNGCRHPLCVVPCRYGVTVCVGSPQRVVVDDVLGPVWVQPVFFSWAHRVGCECLPSSALSVVVDEVSGCRNAEGVDEIWGKGSSNLTRSSNVGFPVHPGTSSTQAYAVLDPRLHQWWKTDVVGWVFLGCVSPRCRGCTLLPVVHVDGHQDPKGCLWHCVGHNQQSTTFLGIVVLGDHNAVAHRLWVGVPVRFGIQLVCDQPQIVLSLQRGPSRMLWGHCTNPNGTGWNQFCAMCPLGVSKSQLHHYATVEKCLVPRVENASKSAATKRCLGLTSHGHIPQWRAGRVRLSVHCCRS